MEVAGNTIKLLRDMLKEVDVVTNPGALNDPTIDELSAQCAQMRPRVVALVQSVSDEALMMKALSLNDELTEVAEKRDALKAAASADRDTRAAIVASMREEEVAAERHGSGAGAGSNARTGARSPRSTTTPAATSACPGGPPRRATGSRCTTCSAGSGRESVEGLRRAHVPA